VPSSRLAAVAVRLFGDSPALADDSPALAGDSPERMTSLPAASRIKWRTGRDRFGCSEYNDLASAAW
jgi:hypothetical protein